jgi:hypothetical protein
VLGVAVTVKTASVPAIVGFGNWAIVAARSGLTVNTTGLPDAETVSGVAALSVMYTQYAVEVDGDDIGIVTVNVPAATATAEPTFVVSDGVHEAVLAGPL